MTKTKYWLPFLAISIALIAGSIAASPIAVATEDGADEPLLFIWDPADISADPNHLIIISGSFARMGLLSDTTSDLAANVAVNLKAKIKNESTTTVEKTAGTTTITTSVEAHSQKAGKLKGTITIDGDTFDAKLDLVGVVTLLQVNEELSSPTFSQSLLQEKITIPVKVKMESDGVKFEGFGTIIRQSSMTSSGGTSVTFVTDSLEAEVIGDSGLFQLKLDRLERIIETAP